MSNSIKVSKNLGKGNGLLNMPKSYMGPLCTKLLCICVFPYIMEVPQFLTLFPKNPHHTCTRPCRLPSDCQRNLASAMGFEKRPKSRYAHFAQFMVHVLIMNIYCSVTLGQARLLLGPVGSMRTNTHPSNSQKQSRHPLARFLSLKIKQSYMRGSLRCSDAHLRIPPASWIGQSGHVNPTPRIHASPASPVDPALATTPVDQDGTNTRLCRRTGPKGSRACLPARRETSGAYGSLSRKVRPGVPDPSRPGYNTKSKFAKSDPK
jgi:hypothetical protein